MVGIAWHCVAWRAAGRICLAERSAPLGRPLYASFSQSRKAQCWVVHHVLYLAAIGKKRVVLHAVVMSVLCQLPLS